MTPAVRRFIANEAGSAAVLLAATLTALVWANSPWSASYFAFWETPVKVLVGQEGLDLDLQHVVNDAAMAVFFLVLGLEISREMTAGELRNRRSIAVPALRCARRDAAADRHLPAGQPLRPGGARLGHRRCRATRRSSSGSSRCSARAAPTSCRLFLLALAVVDDVGAITVMAVFYTEDVQARTLLVAALLLSLFSLLRWLGVWRLTPYVVLGHRRSGWRCSPRACTRPWPGCWSGCSCPAPHPTPCAPASCPSSDAP